MFHNSGCGCITQVYTEGCIYYSKAMCVRVCLCDQSDVFSQDQPTSAPIIWGLHPWARGSALCLPLQVNISFHDRDVHVHEEMISCHPQSELLWIKQWIRDVVSYCHSTLACCSCDKPPPPQGGAIILCTAATQLVISVSSTVHLQLQLFTYKV